MRCEYCGSEQAVPDIEERRKKLRASAKRTHDPNERRRLEDELAQATRVSETYARAAGTASGAVRGLLSVAVFLALVAAGLFVTGWWEHLDNYWRGDAGAKRYQESTKRLRESGYRVARMRLEERALLKARRLYFELDAKSCYGLVVASGKPVAKVLLKNASGREVKRHSTMRYADTTVYCPRRAGVFTALVKLAEPGRFSWGLYKKRGSKSVSSRSLEVRPRRRKAARRRRASGRSRSEPVRSRQKPAHNAKADPGLTSSPAPLPKRPSPKDEVESLPEIPEIPETADDDL